MPVLDARPREGSLDILKLCLAMCVVGLHGHALAEVNGTVSAVLVEGVFRVAVPTFFLISGFFLARMTPAQTIAWLRRLLVLYAIWMIVYVGFWFDPATMTARRLARTLFVGYHHLWFLPALVMAAMLLQLLRGRSSARLLTLAGLAFVIGLAMQYAGNYHLIANPALDKRLNTLWVYRNFLFMGFPFLAIGFLLARHEGSIRLSRTTLSWLMLAGVVLLVAEAAANHAFLRGRESFDLLVTLPLICPVILLWTRSHRVPWDTRALAQVSTGIYLIHVLIQHGLHVSTDWTATPKVAVTILLSLLAAWLGLVVLRATKPPRARVVHAAGRITRPTAPAPAQDASR